MKSFIIVLIVLVVSVNAFFWVPQIYYSIDEEGNLSFRIFAGGKMYPGKLIKGSNIDATGQHGRYKILARWEETSIAGNPIYLMVIMKNGVVIKSTTNYI